MEYLGIDVLMRQDGTFIAHFQGTDVIRAGLDEGSLIGIFCQARPDLGIRDPLIKESQWHEAIEYALQHGHNKLNFGVNGNFIFSEYLNV